MTELKIEADKFYRTRTSLKAHVLGVVPQSAIAIGYFETLCGGIIPASWCVFDGECREDNSQDIVSLWSDLPVVDWTKFPPHIERPGKYRITLTRLKGYRERDFDGDNLQSAFKAVRDGIADYLGIDDGSDRLQWEYRQEKGRAPGVMVEIGALS